MPAVCADDGAPHRTHYLTQQDSYLRSAPSSISVISQRHTSRHQQCLLWNSARQQAAAHAVLHSSAHHRRALTPPGSMGLFDRLKRPADTPASSSQRPESEAAGPDLSASPSAQAPSVSGVPGQDLLDSATISPTSEFAGAPEVSGRFYNPYEGLNQSLDSRGARAPYRLPQQPEFLFSEESTLHRRSWSENLTFYTGVGYLTGALHACIARVRPCMHACVPQLHAMPQRQHRASLLTDHRRMPRRKYWHGTSLKAHACRSTHWWSIRSPAGPAAAARRGSGLSAPAPEPPAQPVGPLRQGQRQRPGRPGPLLLQL